MYAELDKYNDDVSFENFYSYTHGDELQWGKGQLMSESVWNSVGAIFLEFLYTFYSEWYKETRITMENNQNPESFFKG